MPAPRSQRARARGRLLALGALALGSLALGACSPWTRIERQPGWTLYALDTQGLEAQAYVDAFGPALRAVERAFGPFEESVRVHIWPSGAPPNAAGRSTEVQRIPGVGPARIPAWHMRRGAGPLLPRGIYIESPDVGTAVHELVHAHLAQDERRFPLWFEEGLASFFGDGVTSGGEWTVDGLACWPLRQLRDEPIGEQEFARLLTRTSADNASSRDDVLAHFIGWAIVFDLAQESGSRDWHVWLELVRRDYSTPSLRVRLERAIAPGTELRWLERLEDPAPAVRLAALKASWKLRQRAVLERLIEAIAREQDPEVLVGLGVNALAAAGELSLDLESWSRALAAIRDALERGQLQDPLEARALDELRASCARARSDRYSAQRALGGLRRFWEE